MYIILFTFVQAETKYTDCESLDMAFCLSLTMSKIGSFESVEKLVFLMTQVRDESCNWNEVKARWNVTGMKFESITASCVARDAVQTRSFVICRSRL